MDYYEELGLSPAASAEQIRQAYRQLARLIHPDQQPDDGLRRLAEIQMKRLHMILEVLSDPVQRRAYDRSLARPAALVLIPQPSTAGALCRSVWIWAAATLVGIIAIAIFFGYNAATGPTPIVAPKPSNTQPPAINAPIRKPSRKPLPSPAPPEIAKPKPSPATFSPLPEPQFTVTASLPEPILPLPSVEKPSFQSAAKPAFAGNWLYLPSAGARRTPGLYAPEYIEVRIGEKDGQVWGLYQARYLVPDRAISPSVVFRFEGPAATPLSTLRWSGLGGSYGCVTLKLISENALQVSWTANRLSKDLGLISGTATLVRRREP